MLKSGFAESNLDIRNFIVTKYYEQALNQLAKEQPGEPFWQQRLKVFAQRDNLEKPLAALDQPDWAGAKVVSAAAFAEPCCH